MPEAVGFPALLAAGEILKSVYDGLIHPENLKKKLSCEGVGSPT